jgi:hypothetical protein
VVRQLPQEIAVEDIFKMFVLSNVIGAIMIAPAMILLGRMASGVAVGERLECSLLGIWTRPSE